MTFARGFMRSYVKKKCEWRTFGDFKHGRLEGAGPALRSEISTLLGALRSPRRREAALPERPHIQTLASTETNRLRDIFSVSSLKKQQYSPVASGGGISGPIWLSGWTTQESINQIDSPSNSPVCSLDLMRTSVKTRFFSPQQRH